MYFLLLLVIGITFSNAQCTFQGSLARRDEPQVLEHRESTSEDVQIVNRHEARKRAACNADNVLRALKANSAAATTFCATFIDVPTVTRTTTAPGITPTVYTGIEGVGRFYYPNGAHLESIRIPSFVATYPATRISSACSCLSIPTQTTTTTFTTDFVNDYAITTTYTSTLSGLCATQTPYVGGFELGSSSSNFTVAPGNGIDAYGCCFYCNVVAEFDDCAAWISTPGSCLIIKGPFNYLKPACYSGLGNGSVGVNAAKYPNNFGGPGRCAGSIAVCNA